MSQITTITFNPCIDKSTTVSALVPEKKLRCAAPRFEPGGGGLNVARALKKLGRESVAVFPAGGYSGKFLQQMVMDEQVPAKIIQIEGHTRENFIVLDTSTNQQYRFGMPGPQLKESEWQQCLSALEESDAAFIIASGSLPAGVPVDIYAQIAVIARRKGAQLIVDTSGPSLQQAIDTGVYLIKPNLAELGLLAGKEEIDADAAYQVAKDIIARGKCEVIVVSLGASGAFLFTKDEGLHASVPTVERKSTVGAGDSMVAGMVNFLAGGKSMQDVLRYGVACGTAATLNSGTELCKKEDADELYKQITIKKI